MHIPAADNCPHSFLILCTWLSIGKLKPGEVICGFLGLANAITHKQTILRGLEIVVVRLGIIHHFQTFS
jgi:hypothetical protein